MCIGKDWKMLKFTNKKVEKKQEGKKKESNPRADLTWPAAAPPCPKTPE
jgi:hypothetical protein